MQVKRTEKRPGKWANAGLVVSVHWEAFCKEPRAYLTACWWKLRRKRLRSNYQFAGLIGRTSNAYSLWRIHAGAVDIETEGRLTSPPIIVLIDLGIGQGDLDATLESLSGEDVTVMLVGSEDVPTLGDAAAQIDWRQGPWLLPLFAGDTLAPGAIAAYRAVLAGADANVRIVYADDDLIDAKGRGHAPHFKPDWNSELFRHFDYLSGAALLRADREDMDALSHHSNWVSGLVAALAREGTPLHLRRMLHHRLTRPQIRLPAMPTIAESELPPVSIIIPTRNRVDLLRTCVEGVASTDYPDIEVIVVDNDSDDPETLAYLSGLDSAGYQVLRHSGVFNYSAINNRAAKMAGGRLLCLLNNDIEMVQPDWLKIMAVQAQRKDVGAVGAQLLYPDGRIQHAGVTIGMGNAAGHSHRFLKPDEEGYFHRHALPHFTMAVTAACLVVDRDRFWAVGGLNEKDFAVAFNDVDLCLRLNLKGWQSLYEPRARLIHHESVSRGLDRDPVGAARFAKELAALQRIWSTHEVTDPFHHPQLSRASEQFLMQL